MFWGSNPSPRTDKGSVSLAELSQQLLSFGCKENTCCVPSVLWAGTLKRNTLILKLISAPRSRLSWVNLWTQRGCYLQKQRLIYSGWVEGGLSKGKIILGARSPVKHSYTVSECANVLTRRYISCVLQEKIIWKLYEKLLFALKTLTDTYLINQALKILGRTGPKRENVSTKGQLPDSVSACT